MTASLSKAWIDLDPDLTSKVTVAETKFVVAPEVKDESGEWKLGRVGLKLRRSWV